MKNNCVICGAEFEAKGSAKTCGKACSHENFKAWRRAYNRTEKRKAWRRAYCRTEKQKAKDRARQRFNYHNNPKRRAYLTAYYKTYKARTRAYFRAHRQKQRAELLCYQISKLNSLLTQNQTQTP